VVPTHGDVIVSEESGEVLRGEDVGAHKRCQPTACPR
jgi:hypothetical protein